MSTRAFLRTHFHASVHEFGRENQVDAARFERRNTFGERRDRRGSRMSDGDGKSIALRIAGGECKLLEDRVALRDVVEENLA
jgi:hypothetical protein